MEEASKCLGDENSLRDPSIVVSCDDDQRLCCVFVTTDVQRNINFGFAFLNSSTYVLHYFDFKDTKDLAIFESVLLQTRPQECISCKIDNTVEKKKLQRVLETLNIPFTEVSKNFFDATDRDFARIVGDNDLKLQYPSLSSHPLSKRCIFAIHRHLESLGSLSNEKIRLVVYPINSFLMLDSAAFSALSITPSKQTNFSLYNLLNHCRTTLGSRRLLVWIQQPLTNLKHINARLDVVGAFVEEQALRNSIRTSYLRGIPDLDKVASQLHNIKIGAVGQAKQKLRLEDLVKLYESIQQLGGLSRLLGSYEGSHITVLEPNIFNPLKEALENLTQYEKLMEYVVDLKEAENGNFVVSRDFDAALQALASKRDDVYDRIKKLRVEVDNDIFGSVRNTKSTCEEIVKLVDYSSGLVFRVTKKDFSSLKDLKAKYRQVRLNKSEYLFTCSQLVNLSQEYEEACKSYESHQSQLLTKVYEVASSYWPAVEQFSEIVSKIDILCGFAELCISSAKPYVRPLIESEGTTIELQNSRHAVLEHIFNYGGSCSSSKELISNDVYMSYESSRTQIITGPNMGGKSTYIRQVALTILMSQIGCFVPCTKARFPIFHHIMCRVGASDFQLRGVSTFFAEMIEAATILNAATNRSLVIIDELGRGTSTYEGFGLAWAIAKYLTERSRCFCLFATHFHEMSNLAAEVPGVCNKFVSAHLSGDRLNFTYKVLDGAIDQSYGIQVATMADVPSDVVLKAEEKAKELEFVEQGILKNQNGRKDNLKSILQYLREASDATDFVARAKGSEDCFRLELTEQI